MAVKGRWAQGIRPRNFAWVLKDRLAVSERPGGYGANHRKVRRQEEIIWIREQGFSRVVSLIPSPHNLHNYDELGVSYVHIPFAAADPAEAVLGELYPTIAGELAEGGKLLVHQDELGERICGAMSGYLVWSGLVPETPQAVSLAERLFQRQMGPVGRGLVTVAQSLPGPS